MASSKDFEKIWENYQDASKTRSVSIVDYCQRNGIVYAQFQRWYKKHVSDVSVVPVETSTGSIADRDSEFSLPSSINRPVQARVLFLRIELSNGLQICQKSIDFNRLKILVEKLEGLC